MPLEKKLTKMVNGSSDLHHIIADRAYDLFDGYRGPYSEEYNLMQFGEDITLTAVTAYLFGPDDELSSLDELSFTAFNDKVKQNTLPQTEPVRRAQLAPYIEEMHKKRSSSPSQFKTVLSEAGLGTDVFETECKRHLEDFLAVLPLTICAVAWAAHREGLCKQGHSQRASKRNFIRETMRLNDHSTNFLSHFMPCSWHEGREDREVLIGTPPSRYSLWDEVKGLLLVLSAKEELAFQVVETAIWHLLEYFDVRFSSPPDWACDNYMISIKRREEYM